VLLRRCPQYGKNGDCGCAATAGRPRDRRLAAGNLDDAAFPETD